MKALLVGVLIAEVKLKGAVHYTEWIIFYLHIQYYHMKLVIRKFTLFQGLFEDLFNNQEQF